MSAVNTIRHFTETDAHRLERAALRFAARHGFHVEPERTGMSAWEAMEFELYTAGQPNRLRRLWQAAFCRALGYRPCSDLTVACGYVATRCN